MRLNSCVKKVPTFKLSVTLSNLNRFSFFFTAGKRVKFGTKPIRHYLSHLRHVATLPWEIKNSISPVAYSLTNVAFSRPTLLERYKCRVFLEQSASSKEIFVTNDSGEGNLSRSKDRERSRLACQVQRPRR